MFIETSRRRSPSTLYSASMTSRILRTSFSSNASVRLFRSTPDLSRIRLARVRSRKCRSARPRCAFRAEDRLLRCGPSRCSLPLPLLVPRVLADHADDASPLDDLALVANLLDRRSNFHLSTSDIGAAMGLSP